MADSALSVGRYLVTGLETFQPNRRLIANLQTFRLDQSSETSAVFARKGNNTMAIDLKPKASVATFTLSSDGTGVAQTVRVGGSAHEFNVDAAPAFGGHDAAPSPIAYALGALISCSQVTGQIAAKSLGLEVERFHFDISADLDTAVLVQGAAEGNANFESVTVSAVLTTRASDAELRALQAETERRCPIYQLFAGSGVNVSSTWTRATP